MTWLPGATIDVWVPCARGEVATGVPQPHVYFIQTFGDRTAESGSIYCAICRAELAARRSSGVAAPPPPPPRVPTALAVPVGQPVLPF